MTSAAAGAPAPAQGKAQQLSIDHEIRLPDMTYILSVGLLAGHVLSEDGHPQTATVSPAAPSALGLLAATAEKNSIEVQDAAFKPLDHQVSSLVRSYPYSNN